jgi:hypothetical protein
LNRRTVLKALGLTGCAACAVLAYHLAAVRAAGIPTMQPLAYAGYLEQNGMPVQSTGLSMVINVWNDAVATAAANLVCATQSPMTAVSDGRFRVPLDSSCTAQIQANPDTWVEVQVGATSLGRTKVAAVPYALEASHAVNATNAVNAANATGPLATQITAFGVPLHVFLKNGDNGTLSCSDYCADPTHGPPMVTASCVAAQRTDNNAYIRCDLTPQVPITCWCARPM